MLKPIALAVAFACLAFSAWGEPSKPPQTEADARQHHAAPQERGTEAFPLVVETIPKPPSKAETAKDDAAEQHKATVDGEIVDLTGKLALYTGLLFLATFALAVATAFLVRVGFLQVRDAKDSIAASLKAAGAAERSADAAIAGNRPWLKVTIDRTGPLVFDDIDGVSMGTEVHIENVGTSPANKVKVSTGLGIISKKLALGGGDEGIRFAVNKAQISFSERITYDPGGRSDAELARAKVLGDVVFPGENRPVQATNWGISTGELRYILSEGDGSEAVSVFLAASVEYHRTTGWSVTTVVYIVERETGDEAVDGRFWDSAPPVKYDSDIKLRKLQIYTTAT